MEGELFSRRSVLESQDPAALFRIREMLQQKVQTTLGEIALVNLVLDGYGYTRYDPGAAYDADDGTEGSIEHPEDSQWIRG